ncbi:MAG: 50S ribosomal protein L6 [Simkaniaceae bacterium]|nr:50S ribosomal protein L6 [Simkaniaceae bacterium]
MSRLAKKPISIPKGVEVKRNGDIVHVKGPKGSIEKHIPADIEFTIDGSEVNFKLEGAKTEPKFIGLYRAILNNQVVGVSNGFEKRLTLIGVGFRAAVKGNQLDLQLGFSHPSLMDIPSEINVVVEKSTTIVITGADKQIVGQFAANVRSLRPPEPYKGKGVRYENEHVRKKAGKAAKGK